MQNTLAIVLAGGKGTRLEPLTRDRAKPAVPFGGCYRIIDFALSNCLNSGIRKMLVLTQYKAMSLDRHINHGWRGFFCRELDEFIDVVPPQQRIDEQWYQGTADAVYQNIYALEKEQPEYVVILAGDHIYKMNYQSMVQHHIEKGADLTIGALPVSLEEAKSFGVMAINTEGRVIEFAEKPDNPKSIPGETERALASMGIYVFTARFLFEQLCRDATETGSQHDFGKNIIPSIIDSHVVSAYQFEDENKKTTSYWRDVGTLDAFYEANMDLVTIDPLLNMYDRDWPIRTFQPNLPPPKFVFGSGAAGSEEEQNAVESNGEPAPRVGHAIDSIVCNGTVISGGLVERCIVGRNVRINSYSHIEDSIIHDDVEVGRHVKIRRAIIDKGVQIPAGVKIGYDREHDLARGFQITEGGIVVLAKFDNVPKDAKSPIG
jgi:glucose-1-phosphate adenylyltransferase